MIFSARSFSFVLIAVLSVLSGGVRVAASPASTPEARHRLEKAFQAFLDHQGRWAYTETFYTVTADGKRGPKTVVRFDPSQPFAQQRVLVERNGQPPTEKDLKEWEERQQQYARAQEKRLEKEGAVLVGPEEFQIQIYSEKVTPLISEAVVVSENETSVTFAIPLRKAGGADQPRYRKHALTARVSKTLYQFEQAELRQLELLRVAAGKYFDGVSSIDFGSPDPRFPTVQVTTRSEVTNKPLFGGPFRSRNVRELSDHRHVTPYEERFGVKVGPVRTMEF